MLEVELLRQNMSELGMDYNDVNTYLNLVENPFDEYYTRWEKENEENKKVLSIYLSKNKLIDLKQRILEVANHKDNRTIKSNNNLLINRSFISHDKNKIHITKYNIEGFDMLFAKGSYNNLEYLVHLFMFYRKKIFLAECSDNLEHLKRMKEFYLKLKEDAMNSYKKELTFGEDDLYDKKIFMLRG